MDIEIKKTQDFELLAKLNEEIQSLHTRLYPSVFKPYNFDSAKRAFEELLELEHCLAYVAANAAGEAIGYLLCFIDHRPENAFMYENHGLYIDQLYVHDGYQNKGVGTKLLDEAIDFAKHLKMTRVHLDYWTYNHSASEFFEKKGFQNFNNKLEMSINYGK